MYQYPNNFRNPYNNNGDRFIFPFLTGALVGGAAIGLTRPRPIINAYPNYGYYGPRPYGYAPYSYGYNYGYGYYR
ncbi:MAG: hypothetical protein IJ574_01445 [Bacilli bacterium]|nr:hypothetical protein [Bacilli bacterium]